MILVVSMGINVKLTIICYVICYSNGNQWMFECLSLGFFYYFNWVIVHYGLFEGQLDFMPPSRIHFYSLYWSINTIIDNVLMCIPNEAWRLYRKFSFELSSRQEFHKIILTTKIVSCWCPVYSEICHSRICQYLIRLSILFACRFVVHWFLSHKNTFREDIYCINSVDSTLQIYITDANVQ